MMDTGNRATTTRAVYVSNEAVRKSEFETNLEALNNALNELANSNIRLGERLQVISRSPMNCSTPEEERANPVNQGSSTGIQELQKLRRLIFKEIDRIESIINDLEV